MDKLKNPAVISGIALGILFFISLYIRMALPHDQVFVNGMVWFRETDAYYYLRNIEVLIQNFPHYNTFDPYMLFPGGGVGLGRPFFAWLIAGITLITGKGVEIVGAYLPAILGSLVIMPVFFIGKELFNKWVGLMAALLVVILPGEFLHRSLIGFTDHHILEVLFGTTTILFLIMAIKREGRRLLIYSGLAGFFLGLYLLSWSGGALLVLIIFLFLITQFIIDHLRNQSTSYLTRIGIITFLVALAMLLPLIASGTLDMLTLASLLIPIITLLFLNMLRTLKSFSFLFVLIGLAAVGLIIFYSINPLLLQSMLSKLAIFTPSGSKLTVMEVTGLLAPQGMFTIGMAWANFTTSFFLAIFALVFITYITVKERSSSKTLFLIWSLVMLMAALGQRRFGYYYAINAALLTGFLSWYMIDIVRPKEKVEQVVKKFKKRKKRQERKVRPKNNWIKVAIMGTVVFFLVVFPNVGLWKDTPTKVGALYIGYTKSLAQQSAIMNKQWYNASYWLRDNTPEPFGDPEFYYELYPSRSEFEYPEEAYGVLSWWDYGYFIMQVGHRIPNANPGQAGAVYAGTFFTSHNLMEADEMIESLGSKYVMIDNAMATGKFYAMVDWAGRNLSDYYDYYYLPGENQMITLFHPDFYQSMVIRLYNFEGQAYTPPTDSIAVVSYEQREGYREIISAQPCNTYEEAVAFMEGQTYGNWEVVSGDPMVSSIPLEALGDYEMVYNKKVKIFEYKGGI